MNVGFNQTLAVGSLSKGASQTVAAETPSLTTVPVATGQTAFRVNLAVDVSQVKAFLIHSDRAVTIKVNDSGSPAQTFVLAAGDTIGAYDGPTIDAGRIIDLLLLQDITDFYIANASGATANVSFWFAQDSTP